MKEEWGTLQTEEYRLRVKDFGGTTMLWGYFSSHGTGKHDVIDGRMNRTLHCQILNKNLILSVQVLQMKRGWVIQQANDPKHSANEAKYILNRNTSIL